jgi:hypothetical protein
MEIPAETETSIAAVLTRRRCIEMKMNSIIPFLMLVTAAVVFTPAAYAQGSCTNARAAGTYSVSCSGWTAAGPGGSLLPMMQVGVATGDADGNWSGTTTINIGGLTVIPGATVTGKTTVNPDCTGTITYNKGTPTETNISYVMNPKTDETFGLITDKGTVVSCVLKRISWAGK